MRLKGKLLLFLAPLLLIPVAITAWVAYQMLVEQALERTQQMALGQIASEQARLEQMRTDAESSLQVLAGTPLLQRYLLTGDETIRYALIQPALFRLFTNYQAIYPHYDEMRILLPDGFEDARSAVADWKNRTEEEAGSNFFSAWQALEAGEISSRLGFHPDNEGLALILGIKVALRDRAVERAGSKPRLRGYIGISIGLQHFTEQLHQQRIGDGGRMLVVDARGHEQTSGVNTPALILQGFDPQAPAGDKLRISHPEGVQALAYWSRPLSSGYHLVAVLPQDEIYQASRSLAVSVVIISLAALLLLFTGMYLILQRLVVLRLRLLDKATQAIADERDMALDLPDSSDEIGQLSHAFQTMQQRLQQSRQSLKRYQKELEGEVVKAQAADRAKSSFLAKMSHEIRTPMNGVIGMAELLQQTPLMQRQVRYVELIRSSANNLLDIINDILDFSKIEAGKLELRSEPLDIGEMLAEIHQMFEHAASDKGLDFVLVVDPALPRQLVGDSQRLRQILINLIGNALKFTKQGSIELAVTLAAKTEQRVTLRFQVSDTGIGLSQADQQTIFEAFRQADESSSRSYGGTGLGLTIARQLTHLMGGDIGVYSNPGEGTSFWFTASMELNATQQEAARGPAADTVPLEGAAEDSVALPLRILLAEDNQVNQIVAEEMLNALGCEFVLAVNGQEVVDQARAERFDIILMDCHMPGIDGCQATHEIRRFESTQGLTRTPVIAVTANVYESDRKHALGAGIDDFLGKPYDKSSLQRILNKWSQATDMSTLRWG